MNIIILGPQGSGKGTQAKLLAAKFNLVHLSTGDLLRDLSRQLPDVRKIINKGELLPDDLVLSLIKSHIEERGLIDKLILDGTPRTLYQYEDLKLWLKQKNSRFDFAILLNISDEESIRRLSARRQDKITGKIYNLVTNPPGPDVPKGNLIQRSDDQPEAIRRRLRQYHKQSDPLIAAMKQDGVLVEVDGQRPIEKIFEDLVTIIKKGKSGENHS